MANLLSCESSPYLQQHALNPVDWYPWGDEAFNRAKQGNKPIFLSVGYSACHWCHVMEKESFEDPEIGQFMSEHFVCIKVDREERPDVDHIYMTALQSMVGGGGWPMSMFLTPNGEPFYGGTYFPKEDRQGRAGFLRVLQTIANHWDQEYSDIIKQSRHLTQHLKAELDRSPEGSDPIPSDILAKSVGALHQFRDQECGGFFDAPKFPNTLFLDLSVDLLRDQPKHPQAGEWQEHLTLSLDAMANGGLYDHLSGGFHRYSTDKEWLVPHYEKMLNDQALLARTYLHASAVTNTPRWKQVAQETCDYVLKEMSHPQGAFYASTDADSEGVEGLFFIWTQEDIRDALGENDGAAFSDIFQITAKKSSGEEAFAYGTPPHEWLAERTLHRSYEVQTQLGVTDVQIKEWKQALYHQRLTRKGPFRDEKILTSWNGLMATTLSDAYTLIGNKTYLQAAQDCLSYIFQHAYKDHLLYASCKDGKTSHRATLEDYANIIQATVALHRAGDDSFLLKGRQLLDQALELFMSKSGAFYYSSSLQKDLFIRSKNIFDHAIPSANAVFAESLLFFGNQFDVSAYILAAEGIFAEVSSYMNKSPQVVSSFIKAYHRQKYLSMCTDETCSAPGVSDANIHSSH